MVDHQSGKGRSGQITVRAQDGETIAGKHFTHQVRVPGSHEAAVMADDHPQAGATLLEGAHRRLGHALQIGVSEAVGNDTTPAISAKAQGRGAVRGMGSAHDASSSIAEAVRNSNPCSR